MLLFAAVMSSALPPPNVVTLTVADDQPDSNWPAAPEASSTPLCRSEVRLPFVPLTVNTSPEPVSNVKFVAAETNRVVPSTPAPASTSAVTPSASDRPRRGRAAARRSSATGRKGVSGMGGSFHEREGPEDAAARVGLL